MNSHLNNTCNDFQLRHHGNTCFEEQEERVTVTTWLECARPFKTRHGQTKGWVRQTIENEQLMFTKALVH